MKFLSASEAEAWCRAAGATAPKATSEWPKLRCALPPQSARVAWFSSWLVIAVPGVGPRLLWPRDWGIWSSSENWTLIKRLRAGYGESRPFEEAPVVEAQPSEIEDLAPFVQVAITSGWDASLLGSQDLLHVQISHDEWVEFRTEDTGLLDSIRADLEHAEVEIIS